MRVHYKQKVTAMTDKDPWKGADPMAAQEAAKYADPVPSRVFILQWLEKKDLPVNLDQVCRAFKVSQEQQVEAVRRRLMAMVRDGQLHLNRKGFYGLIKKLSLVVGSVRQHHDGHGIFRPDEGTVELYIPAVHMRQIMDGDRVSVRPSYDDPNDRRYCQVIEVLSRAHQEMVGRVYKQSGIAYLMPENPRLRHHMLLSNCLGAKDGDVVVARIDSYPDLKRQPVGKVTEVLGAHLSPGMEIDMAIRTFNLPWQWSDPVLQELTRIPDAVEEPDLVGRVDLRNRPFVTIDGEDARDFDDAVLVTKLPKGGYRLWVAIADVGHYVQPGSELDAQALERGNSVYFPGRVVPMLPEKISNGLCSLNPNQDRLVMVCEMDFSDHAELLGYQFYEAVIHSQARLTYTQVAAFLRDPEDSAAQVFSQDLQHLGRGLHQFYDLYQLLWVKRQQRGAIEFETQEPIIVFNSDRKIERIDHRERNDAHKMIEEAMLAANQCAALLLQTLEVPALYRVHEGPKEERLQTLLQWLSVQGLSPSAKTEWTPQDFRQLLQQVADRPDKDEIQTMVLRSMSQAVYQPDNQGHFGLAYESYTHFTSPIRRYADLLVHRAIRSLLRSGKRHSSLKRVRDYIKQDPSQSYPYDMPALLEAGMQVSMTERRADDATRDVIAWLKCEYMQDKVGQEFEGRVSAVRPFGLFVTLIEHSIDGMVHISALGQDYFQFDNERMILQGERSGKVFRAGQPVRVRLMSVNLDERKIDFELASNPIKLPRRSKRSGKIIEPRGANDGKPSQGKRSANGWVTAEQLGIKVTKLKRSY